MSLNKRISEFIEFTQLSPSEFADAVEVQRSSISHITSGRNKPSLDFLIKVREKYPELQWEWLILGEGEMLKSNLSPESDKQTQDSKAGPLPDLFSLINDENFGLTESEDRVMNSPFPNPQTEMALEQPKTEASQEKMILSDSQPIATTVGNSEAQGANNEVSKLKRIVLFYENGKFESFEP